VAAERAAWKASQPEIDFHRLVFIDETVASTKMARLYGRLPCGQCRNWQRPRGAGPRSMSINPKKSQLLNGAGHSRYRELIAKIEGLMRTSFGPFRGGNFMQH
jgi:hypothetical protein